MIACDNLKDNLPVAGVVTVSKETVAEGLKTINNVPEKIRVRVQEILNN